MKRHSFTSFLIFIFILLYSFFSEAQNFGRNQTNYRTFNYKIYKTPHFEIYHYFDNDSIIKSQAQRAEEWYLLHRKFFYDTLKTSIPVILYTNQIDFQQTTANDGLMNFRTGITDDLKKQIAMPLASSIGQTDRVFGHKLVHSFLYQYFKNSDSVSLRAIRTLPVWMVEGLAEYLSSGSVDAHTAMYLRDAILNNDFPSLYDLSETNKYSAYQFGHAFWATIARTWGNSVILPLLENIATYSMEEGLDPIIGYSVGSFSEIWKTTMKNHFEKYITDSANKATGRKLIHNENAGDLNFSPSLSPDGKYLAFITQSDLFTRDLYLADTETGEILQKLNYSVLNNEVEDFNAIESAGTWSPDGQQFAFTIIAKGQNKLAIIHLDKKKKRNEIEIAGVPVFNNPAWSPDGQKIVVSGLVNGIIDLYSMDLNTLQVQNLTKDNYSDLQPSWSSDGKYIVFATDKQSLTLSGKKRFNYQISILDVEKGTRTDLFDIFQGANNLNPVFSPDNQSVFFLSDADGMRNLYRYSINDKKTYKMTEFITGISGLTELSPAISIARTTGRLAYSYFFNAGYQIYDAQIKDFGMVEVSKTAINMEAATLPGISRSRKNSGDTTLFRRTYSNSYPAQNYFSISYYPTFGLDYVSKVVAPVATGRYSSGMPGSVNSLINDIVNRNQVFINIGLNGGFYDFSGQIAYMNQKNKIKWGASFAHIPYNTGSVSYKIDTLKDAENKHYICDNEVYDFRRIFEDQLSIFAYFPFSINRRFEAGASASWYYFKTDRYNNYYSIGDNSYSKGEKIKKSKERIPEESGFNLQKLDVAYMEDNSRFGLTSPMQGHRTRIQVEQYLGELNFYTLMVDYRKYFYVRPFCLAVRAIHYGRYGNDSETGRLNPLFVGHPWYMRGYDNFSFMAHKTLKEEKTLTIDQLTGNRMVVGNVELRFPLLGPERTALIRSKFFHTELSWFFDGGMAWNSEINPTFKWEPKTTSEHIPVFSTGLSVRVNVFGIIIVEPFYALPLQRKNVTGGVWGFNFIPGW